MHIPSLVSTDLGCFINMIDHNLDIISKLERARDDLFQQSLNKGNLPQCPGSSEAIIPVMIP